MKDFPSIPEPEDVPSELFDGGHLWIQEKIDGAHLRFQLRESGVLRFGGRRRTFDADDVPDAYRHAVRHVRERLDRDALRAAVDEVESVVFFGEATHRHRLEYDWERTPSFLGFAVWSETREEFLPPDAVEQIYDRLGVTPVNTFEKEVRAVDFDPESYEIPSSNWRDGPPEGVVVRNKTGLRAQILHPGFAEGEEAEPISASADELARRYATPDRLDRVEHSLTAEGTPATVDVVYERVLEELLREKHARLTHRETAVDRRALRSELAALVREFVDDRDG